LETADNRGNETIAMITKLVSNDNNNSFKLLLYYILTRQEKERLVLELYYSQGKTYHEISKVARISPRDIGAILNKVIEQKKQKNQKKNKNSYLFPLKPTNPFPIQRIN
jgi:DNA-directed RNA polymerase specialized sigma subunit